MMLFNNLPLVFTWFSEYYLTEAFDVLSSRSRCYSAILCNFDRLLLCFRSSS